MKNLMKVVIFTFILILSITRPTLSYAEGHGHGGGHGHFEGHGHGRYSFGVNLSLWPDSYYYSQYYPYYVSPNYGVVYSLGYQPVLINGVTYYLNNGNYYVYTEYGYQLIPPPVTVVQASPTVITMDQTQPAITAAPVQATPASASIDTENSFTVNIPNDKGEFTPVVIKRSGKGFVGPQGEFYPEFPKVSQLKLMYVK